MIFRIKVLSCTIATLWPIACFAAAGGDMRLVEAMKNQDTPLVQSLLSQHVDVNARQADGATALIWAAHWDNLKTASLLIRAGAKTNLANDEGVTPMWEACNNGSTAMVQRLAQAGGDPNAVLPGTGETVLMRCASTGSADAMKALLTRGANPNVKENRKGQTALMWAVSEQHPAAARMLIEFGASVAERSKSGFTPLLFACRQGDLDSARTLVEKGADVNVAAANGLTPLLVAADSGYEQLAIFLVEHGGDVNAADPDGLTAMHYALRGGITNLASIGGGGRYPFSEAYLFRPNMSALVKVLLEHGANPNARVQKGTKLTANLDPGKADVPELGLAGATPFLLAAATSDVATMQVLLDKGADFKINTRDGVTPLMAAAGIGRSGHRDRSREEQGQAIEVIKLMLKLGADINASSDDGLTALHGAAFSGANDVVQLLVDHGARLDSKDRLGQTALSRAEGDLNGLSDYHGRYAHASTAELIRKLQSRQSSLSTDPSHQQ